MATSPRLGRIELWSALGASVAAGAVSGACTVAVFSVVNQTQFTVWWLVQTGFAISIAAAVGGIVGLLPGLVVSFILQILKSTRLGLPVGSAVGALLTFAVFRDSSDAQVAELNYPPPISNGHLLLVLCWAVGGGAGGLLLHRWYESRSGV